MYVDYIKSLVFF